MAIKILVPSLGESVTEGIVASWIKQPGEHVDVDEVVMELETDKVTIEVLAPEAALLFLSSSFHLSSIFGLSLILLILAIN